MKIINLSCSFIVFLLLYLIAGCFSNHHQNYRNKKDKSISIEIKVRDTVGINKQIRVVVFSELPEPLYANQGNYREYKVDLSTHDKLINLNTHADIAYIKFFDCSNKINGKPFIIMPGDSCKLSIEGDAYNLSFSNSELFSLQEKIYNIPIDIYQGHDYTKPEYNSFFIKYRDSLMNVINAVVRDYKRELPSNLLNLIQLNMVSEIGISYANTISSIPSILPKGKWKSYTTCLNSLISEYKNQSNYYVKNSYNYAYYGNRLLRSYYLFTMHSNVESAADCTYQAIVKNFSGLLRDKMLCILFNSRSNSRNWTKLMKGAASIIQDTIYKQSITSLINSQSVGSRAYEFHLLSDNGRYYSLDDFKGKVIVCHLWFTGCHGCSALSKVFKYFEQKYNDRKDILFININVDSDTIRWKKGLASGLYSDKSEINLNIGRKGWSDDMLKYYGYFGYPQILLIDQNGDIISSNPEYSSYTIEGLKSVDSLIYSNTKKEDNNVSS